MVTITFIHNSYFVFMKRSFFHLSPILIQLFFLSWKNNIKTLSSKPVTKSPKPSKGYPDNAHV